MTTSAHLFDLASDFGIPFSDGPLEDEQFFRFRESYLQWSDQRDTELIPYLQQTPKLFRVYLPYSDRILHTAVHVVWYFDEVVFRDPIANELVNVSTELKSEKDRERLEEQKDKIRSLLQSLSFLRNAIDQGYLLFGGPKLFPTLPDLPTDRVETILESPEVKSAIAGAIDWIYTPFVDESSGATGHVFQGSLDSSKWWEMQAKIPANQTARIMMQHMGRQVTHEELSRTLGHDPLVETNLNLGLTQHVFSRAVSWPIKAVQRANQFGAAVLFDRNVDEVILRHASDEVDNKRQSATVGLLNISVPYVRNIPVERLADLREQMPSAFKDFRGRLLEVVNAARKEDNSDEAIHQRVEREIVSQVRSLDSEVKAALARANILQRGIPIFTAIGVLAGLRFGVDPKWLITAATAAASSVLVEQASKVQTHTKAQGHPFYFLWKAQQGRSPKSQL